VSPVLKIGSLIAVLLFLQMGVLPPFQWRTYGPDLPFLMVGFASFYAPARRALWISWSTGLTVDLGSLGPLGLHAFAYTAVTILLVKIRSHLFQDHAGTQGGAVAVGSAVVCLGQGTCLRLWGLAIPWTTLLHQSAGTGLLTGMLAPLFFLCCRPMRRGM
jgi:rod shape-determining protein MreD